ncbi:hypothetical protein KCU61_g8653, partial [Aureobasidium melanogenum]
MSLRGSSKWGKLLRKNEASDKNFKLNEDVVDFLKPSTERERIPGEGTRQLPAPRIDTAAAQRWPDAADVRRAAASPPEAYPAKPKKKKKNVNVSFVRTPPEIIGEGGDDSEVPVVEVARAKARLARSQTERRAAAPVLDTQAAERHRQPANYPMSAPAVRHAYQRNNSLADPTHPVNHPFFESQPQPVPPPVPQHGPAQESPRPGMLKRAPTTFSSLEDDPISPTSDEDVPPIPPHVELPMRTIRPPESPISPPIIDNTELASFLQDSPPQPRSLPPRDAKRQSMIREEEGRVLRRLSRLDYDEATSDALDPRRPPSPNSPPRESRSRSPQLPSIVPTDFGSGIPDHLRSTSPEQPAPPIVLPHRAHPLPEIPSQHDDTTDTAITTRNMQPSFSSSHYTNDSTHSASSHRQRLPSDFLASSSPASSVRSASLQPNNLPRMPLSPNAHPLPQPPSRGPSPSYFSQQSLAPQAQNFNGLTPGITPGHAPGLASGHLPTPSYDVNGRSGSAFSYRNVSPPEHVQGTAEHDALFDFGMRVAHMRGVFRLTAERERPIQSCTVREWIRAAIWWLHKGRAGLTVQIRSTPKGTTRPETLTQAHVDVAKTWWILTDVLSGADSPHSKIDSPQDTLLRDMDIVRASLRTFTLSMSRNNVMPPHQSLIQGQDTTMWVEYPRFASDVAALLRGNTSQALIAQDEVEEANPLEALPLGDTRDTFCYSRMFVSASINTDEADTDRVLLPCVLTMIRAKSEFQTSVVISSQADLVNITIKPGDGGYGRGPTWHDVSWKSKEHGLYVRLPRGFTLNLAFQEPDFRSLWSMVDYTNKIYSSVKPEADERMVHEAHLVELAHTDSTNPNAFSKDKVRSCRAFVFEKRLHVRTGLGETNLHRGYRLLLMANPVNKSLTMAGIPLCRVSPLLFEMTAGNEPPVMHVYTQDSKRQCRTTLTFKSGRDRQDFYEVLQGISTDQDEQVVARVGLRTMTAEASAGQDTAAGAFQGLAWKDVRVVTEANAAVGQDQGDMTLSEHFRVIATHESGAVTDRLNLGPGELLLRLPASKTPSLSLLRAPQEDLTASLDIAKAQHGREGLKRFVQTAATTPTTRTLTFPSLEELHTFQKALTRYTVKFDGTATLFAIARRRMVVPIYKKWEATKVRIQILTLGNTTKIAAFFEDFSHADAMVFQIKAADTFEKAKGDKPAKYCVKFVDAKFSLPKKEKDGEGGEDEPPSDSQVWGKGVRRKFINLEGLEYAGEHDDITIGFETEEERDRFSEGLPAATTNKVFQLRRKI